MGGLNRDTTGDLELFDLSSILDAVLKTDDDSEHDLRPASSEGTETDLALDAPSQTFTATDSCVTSMSIAPSASTTPGGDEAKKSDICKHWARGFCNRGYSCAFAHTGPQAAPTATGEVASTWRSMEVCKDYTAGKCNRNKRCKFLHVGTPVVPVCRDWTSGVCKRGANCKFLHSMGGNAGFGAPHSGMVTPPGQDGGMYSKHAPHRPPSYRRNEDAVSDWGALGGDYMNLNANTAAGSLSMQLAETMTRAPGVSGLFGSSAHLIYNQHDDGSQGDVHSGPLLNDLFATKLREGPRGGGSGVREGGSALLDMQLGSRGGGGLFPHVTGGLQNSAMSAELLEKFFS